jgi:rSAM/selenodomain-associated transferase 2
MISIIIPTLNEEKSLPGLLQHLGKYGAGLEYEIIVSDCGSTDNTQSIAKEHNAKLVVTQRKSRAAQMNAGAKKAKFGILYFIHADTIPPPTFHIDILKAAGEGYNIGRYKTKFDSKKWLLKLNAWFTRFDLFVCYGGDQTLFITKLLFETISGFDESLQIMEEYHLVERARKQSKYKIMDGYALVSSRKYIGRTWLQVQRANYTAARLYKKKASQKEILTAYQQLLKITEK